MRHDLVRRMCCLAVVSVLGVSACGSPPAGEGIPRVGTTSPTPTATAVVATTTVGTAATSSTTAPPRLDVEAATRAATLRLEVVRCDGTVVGSGFLIDDHTIVTNRHVVEHAEHITATSWTGRVLTVLSVSQVLYVDLGVITIEPTDIRPLTLASLDADTATPVQALGYPLGGAFTRTRGYVAGYVMDEQLGNLDRVMRLDIEIQPGNSGGPLVDDQGSVVAVVYGVEWATTYSLAVPVTAVAAALRDRTSIEAVVPC